VRTQLIQPSVQIWTKTTLPSKSLVVTGDAEFSHSLIPWNSGS
jgi:hypothetical protein